MSRKRAYNLQLWRGLIQKRLANGKSVRVWVACKELVQEGQGGHLGIFQNAELKTRMLLPKPEPAIEDTRNYAEALIESFHRERIVRGRSIPSASGG